MDKLLNSANSANLEIKYYNGDIAPSCATQYMKNILLLCSTNLRQLQQVSDRNVSYMKRVLHWETLHLIIVNCTVENVALVESIISTFKSPRKWVLDTSDPDDAYTGCCSYADLGTLYAKEYGIKFIYNDGREVILDYREARM